MQVVLCSKKELLFMLPNETMRGLRSHGPRKVGKFSEDSAGKQRRVASVMAKLCHSSLQERFLVAPSPLFLFSFSFFFLLFFPFSSPSIRTISGHCATAITHDLLLIRVEIHSFLSVPIPWHNAMVGCYDDNATE
ncbi:hypothetical protein E2542_SST30008 [Spatholobus suberectus]|nr:hypothetical protein E2542_SST30008 [Spatholobus suberectus]